MGERKVLNKYFPPDFDPADMPKGQRQKDNAMKVRMMLPMTVRCKTCGEFMYKGTKFNCKKEDVAGETYLGLQIFRFYMHCRKCSAEITYVTDPQNLDYKVEHGASRNFEVWKQEQSVEEALKAKRAAEDEDKLKRIENKTADAKREMDMYEALDDMLHASGQHKKITPEAAIAALKEQAHAEAEKSGTGDLTEADEEALRLMIEGGKFTKRLGDDEEAPKPAAEGPKRLGAVKRVSKKPNPLAALKRKLPVGNGTGKPPGAEPNGAAGEGKVARTEGNGEQLGQAVKPDSEPVKADKAVAQAGRLGLGGYSSSDSDG